MEGQFINANIKKKTFLKITYTECYENNANLDILIGQGHCCLTGGWKL